MAELVIKLVNGELAGKTMQQINKDVNAAAVSLKKAEVGTQAWVDANGKLEKAKGLQADLKKQIDSTSTASNALKNSFGGILNQIPGFSQLSGALGTMKGGVGGLTSGFGLLRGAIIATGVGALLIAVMVLFSWFTKTEKGANMIAGAFNALGAVVDTLISRLFNIGQTLKDLFSDPMKFFKTLGSDIAAAAKEGYDLVQMFDALEDQVRELDLANAQTEKTVSQLLLQSKNVGKSFQERMAIIDQANALEQTQFDARMKYARDYEAAVLREVAAAEKTGTMNDTLADKLKDAQVAKIKLETDLIEFQEKLANRRTVLQEKEQAEREKANKIKLDAEKKALEEENAAKENIRNLENEKRLMAVQDEKAKEIEQLAIDTEEKIIALQGSEAQIFEQMKLLRDLQGAELANIDKKWADKKAEEDKKGKDEQKKRDEKLLADQKKLAEDKIKFEEEIADIYRDIALDSFGFATDVSAKLLKDEASARKVRKAGAILEIAINLQRELSANAAAASLNPLNISTFGAAGAAQLTATNIRSIVRAAISTAKVIAFRRGGVLKGPSHESNGIPFSVNGQSGFEAEGDEILLTKGVYRSPALRRAASSLNVLGGGKQFAAGGPINPFQDRPAVRGGRAGSTESLSLDPAMNSKMDVMISLLQAWPTKLKVINVLTDTEEGIRTLNEIRDAADV